MLTCSVHSIRDNFAFRSRRFIYFKASFSCQKHQGKIYKTQRILVANLATNFWSLVASTIILVTLATVLGAIWCPWVVRIALCAYTYSNAVISNRSNTNLSVDFCLNVKLISNGMVSWLAGTVWSLQFGEYGKRSVEEGEGIHVNQWLPTKGSVTLKQSLEYQATKRRGGNEKLNC